jgi:hypothetical protein
LEFEQKKVANEKQQLVNESMRKTNEETKIELYSAKINLIRLQSVNEIELERFNALKEKVAAHHWDRNDGFKQKSKVYIYNDFLII